MNHARDQRSTLRFVRHGVTAANLLGLRCGGDLDLALIEAGREQAAEVALRIAALEPPVGVIVTSDLQRTRETAQIIARALGKPAIVVEPDFAERSLGEWNLRSIDRTQAWLDQGLTPPGGEARDTFAERIARAARRVIARFPQRPLLVGSKGVARVLGELSGRAAPVELQNADLAEYDLQHLDGFPMANEVSAVARRLS